MIHGNKFQRDVRAHYTGRLAMNEAGDVMRRAAEDALIASDTPPDLAAMMLAALDQRASQEALQAALQSCAPSHPLLLLISDPVAFHHWVMGPDV